MNPEHFPHSEREHFQPAGRVYSSDGSVDKPGTWVVGGNFTREDSSGQEIEYIRLLRSGGGNQGTISMKGVPVEQYEQWQVEQETEIPEQGIELFSARERQIFAPLQADRVERGYGETPAREDISEEKREDALTVLEAAHRRDARLKQILRDRFTREDTDEDVLAALRSDAELRCTIGRYFMSKIPTLTYLPDRILRNDPRDMKNPEHSGYTRMTSHEYVALLALSMIDGSFDKNTEDRTYTNEFGEPLTGQHLFAARELLNAYDV